jgi:hypothetical protein
MPNSYRGKLAVRYLCLFLVEIVVLLCAELIFVYQLQPEGPRQVQAFIAWTLSFEAVILGLTVLVAHLHLSKFPPTPPQLK